MRFLNAKQVKLTNYYDNCRRCKSIETWDSKTQYFYVDMATSNSPNKTEVVLNFDEAHPVPKTLCIRVEQQATKPMRFEIKLLRFGESKPYHVQPISEHDIICRITPDTNRIVISCLKSENAGKTTRARLHAKIV